MEVELQDVARRIQRAHAAGLAFSLLAAVVGQALLTRLPAGNQPAAAVQDIGYACTGLSLLGALALWRRGRRQPEAAAARPLQHRARTAVREYLLFAGAGLVGLGFGLFYWSLAGPQVERHARTFLALGPIAFGALAPRPRRWTSAPAGQGPAAGT